MHSLFQTANGRVVYVDHKNRRTQWERPTVASQRQQPSHVESERRRMAYTLARRNPGEEARHTTSYNLLVAHLFHEVVIL